MGKTKLFLSASLLVVFAAVVGLHTVTAATSAVLLPDGDGAYSQWTPNSGSTHYTRVDETNCNGTTDYNRETTVGERDSYTVSLATVPTAATITQIEIVPCASRNTTGSGSSTLNVFYRYSGADSADAGGYALPTGITPQQLATTTFSGLDMDKGASSTLQIGAVYSSGNRGIRLSRIATVITYTALTAPTSTLAHSPTTTTMEVSWSDLSSNEDGFNVERATSTNGVYLTVATTTANTVSFSDSGLSPGQQYCYRVRAYNTGGYSAYSNSDCETTSSTTPIAPSALSTTSSAKAVGLSWTDNSSDESGFQVERSTNSSSGPWSQIATSTPNMTTYEDSNVDSDQTYCYRVRAYNGAGNSTYTNTSCVVTYSSVPGTPHSLVATATSTTDVVLTWNDNATNEDTYRIERGTDGINFTEIDSVDWNVSTYLDAGLSSGTYYYQVRALNVIGYSGYSNTASSTIP